MSSSPGPLIVMGKMSAPFGVKGWVKVTSFTDPPEGILNYKDWLLVKNGATDHYSIAQGKPHGKFVVVKFDGIDNRDAAALLTHAEIQVSRSQMPTSDEDFYWVDLIGLQVQNKDAVDLGVVESLMETGANDVLVVKGDRERLIPWIAEDVILTVDLDNSLIIVDWDPGF